ncbi:UDP-glucuronic acid decarboxylase family protein [Acidimangrovimonas pyrenivorans]|uniref:UDP-glucuronic acid decarboxylase family protein n=1 Tax=Acidimangrovimonas pyrenivorans TaxID=2030798 RepID=A0ABV7AHP5_9RHOB
MGSILVSGGAGFVGSFLCEALLDRGEHVVCLDNLQTGSLGNILHLVPNERFLFSAQDVELPLSAFNDIEQIYNLACPASPVHYQNDPIRTLRTNVIGAINILELARRTGARVLQASTSEVYGDPEIHPQSEGYRGSVTSFGPRACYDEGKRAAETLFHDYCKMYDVDIRIARIFNTYGPNMAGSDGRVVSNFIMQALSGQPITIYGEGKQTRSFCYVTDLVEGLIRLMNAGPHMRQPCNLGNPTETTIRELAEHVIEATGSSSELQFLPLPQDDPIRRRPDISLAFKNLGWQPTTHLPEGLARTVEYFESHQQQRPRAMTQPSRGGPIVGRLFTDSLHVAAGEQQMRRLHPDSAQLRSNGRKPNGHAGKDADSDRIGFNSN